MTVQPTDLQTGIQSRLNPEQIAQILTFIISLCNLECCGKRQKGCEFLAAIIMSADFTQNSIAAAQSSSDWSLAPQFLFLPTSGNTRVNIKQLSDRTKRRKKQCCGFKVPGTITVKSVQDGLNRSWRWWLGVGGRSLGEEQQIGGKTIQRGSGKKVKRQPSVLSKTLTQPFISNDMKCGGGVLKHSAVSRGLDCKITFQS